MTSPRLMIVLPLLVIYCGGCGEREAAAPPTEKAVSVSQEPRVHYPKGMSQEEIEDLKRLEAEGKVRQQENFELEMLNKELEKILISFRTEADGREPEFRDRYYTALHKFRRESRTVREAQGYLEESRFQHQEVSGKTLAQFAEKWYDPNYFVKVSPEEYDAYLRSMGVVAGPGIIPRPGEPGYTPANAPKAQ